MQHDEDKARRVVFLKLQKTAGTTLAGSILYPYCVKHDLRYVVPRDWYARDQEADGNRRFHMMFRHFPAYPEPAAQEWLRRVIGDYQTFTILRDPVDRFVSAFNHMAHYWGVDSIEKYRHQTNIQSRWLGYRGRDPGFLARNFSGVGTTEQFNQSMLLFRRLLKLELADILYVSVYRHVPKKLRREDLTGHQVTRIREADNLDYELHQQATELVDQRFQSAPGAAEELGEYEQALADYSHPLWDQRGPFQVGFSPDNVWYEFTGRHGTVKQLRDVPP